LAQGSAPGATTSAPAAATAPAPAGAPLTEAVASIEKGKLALYGRKFAGHRTASGERYDPDGLTMAHKTLPFGTLVKVTNPGNGKSVTVRVNDRGPAQQERVGDVSLEAARRLGMVRSGVIDAELEVLAAAPAKKR